MNIKEYHDKLTELFPKELSASWDNDGIMFTRSLSRDVKRVLVSLDPTRAAIKFASEKGFDALLTHHPLIFKGVRSVTGADVVSSRLIAAMESDISVVSLHTRLDAGTGGVNDALACKLGFEVIGAFGDDEAPELGRLAENREPMDLKSLSQYVERILGGSVRVYGDRTAALSRVALVGGSGKDFILPAMGAGADVMITGESGYNAAEAAAESGFCIIEAGHYETEFPVCENLATYSKNLGIEAVVFKG